MLAALADPILPIFAVLAAGFFLRRVGAFGLESAQAINRFVFFLGAPALVFVIIATAPLDRLNLPALAVYFLVEIAIYATVASIARLRFDRPLPEALLLGMAAVFSNHVFFVRPMAVLVYGAEAAHPIAGIVVFDALIFIGSVVAVDVAYAESPGPRAAISGLVKNPFIYAPILAGVAWYLGDLTPQGIFTFAEFAGGAAAPVSLFALGVVLAGLRLGHFGTLLWIVVAAKLLVHPLLVSAGLPMVGASGNWALMPVLVAAGPCGAMPFVIATQYGVNTEMIAKAVLISSALSVLTLAFLIQ